MTLLNLLMNKRLYSLDASDALHKAFESEHLVRLPAFYEAAAFDLVRAEVHRLSAFQKRRDFQMAATDNTPRRMSTVGAAIVNQYSSLLPILYRDPSLLSFLTGIAGEPVWPAPDPNEDVVCNFLHRKDDTHGAHLDTFPFAFNLTLEAAAPGKGGLLEVWPGPKAAGSPQYHYFVEGECYFLRSDKFLHGVTPLSEGQRRTVLNFAFANNETLNTVSYSSSILYGHDDAQ
jgi:hypothetical protein